MSSLNDTVKFTSETANKTAEGNIAAKPAKTTRNRRTTTSSKPAMKEEKKEDVPEKSKEDQFNEEASKVEVPTSLGANAFRQQLNEIIEQAPLHPEIILEILRSCLAAVESVATEVANKELQEYQDAIQKLRDKYGVKQ